MTVTCGPSSCQPSAISILSIRYLRFWASWDSRIPAALADAASVTPSGAKLGATSVSKNLASSRTAASKSATAAIFTGASPAAHTQGGERPANLLRQRRPELELGSFELRRLRSATAGNPRGIVGQALSVDR